MEVAPDVDHLDGVAELAIHLELHVGGNSMLDSVLARLELPRIVPRLAIFQSENQQPAFWGLGHFRLLSVRGERRSTGASKVETCTKLVDSHVVNNIVTKIMPGLFSQELRLLNLYLRVT